MDEAAPQAAGSSTPQEFRAFAIKELRWHWGDAYKIGWDPDRGYWGRRRDGKGTDITAGTASDLLAALRADYHACPVPRSPQAPLAE